MLIEAKSNDMQVLHALVIAPAHMTRHLDRGVGRIGEEMAREARIRAPKAFSLLTNSINSSKTRDMERNVGAHVAYDRALQEGTGPAVGKARYFPDPKRLEEYIARRSGLRRARAGSMRRFLQESSLHYRAHALARFIYTHGTRPHPYLKETTDALTPRAQEIFTRAAAEGLRTLPEPTT